MKKTMNIDSAFVCHCARIRHSELLEIFSESAEPSYENFKRQYGIGGQCASCEYEVKAILDEYMGGRSGVLALPKHPLRQRLLDKGASLRRWVKSLSPTPRPVAQKVNSWACMFYILKEGMQSSIVISNVNNPESNVNPNHGAVFFQLRIHDGTGRKIHQTGMLKLAPNETKELFASDIFEKVPEGLIGSAYVEFYDLQVTNTLRPYCALNYFGPDGNLRSRQHYHDKIYTGIIPGFVQSPSVFMPGRECWIAMVNCNEREFDAVLHLRIGRNVRQIVIHFVPRQTTFRSISEVFGLDAEEETKDAHFWIESERYVMTYFFWHARETDVWIGQHH